MTIDQKIIEAIEKERTRQDNKFGVNKEQSLPGYMLIISNELKEAEHAWTKNIHIANQSCLEELVQVAATVVKCLEVYGVKGSATATNDITT